MRKLKRSLLALQDRILGTPFPGMERAKQITLSHCGPAVLSSLYSHLKVRVSQRKVVASLRAQNKIKKFGLNMKDMARGASIAGKGNFTFWKKQNARISDLDLAINKYKTPVGVEWQGVFYEDEDEDNGHFSIVTKIDKGKGLPAGRQGYLRIADPYYKFVGLDRKFNIKEFEKRWWDENLIKGKNIRDKRVMFVITPKSDTWPKKLGMQKS